MSTTEESTSSDTSPNTKRWNKMEEITNEMPTETPAEIRKKLRQKIMLKRTRRLSKAGQNYKIKNIKQQMLEKEQPTKLPEQSKQQYTE